MDYVKQFLDVEGTIGQGTYGRVLSARLHQVNSNNYRFALKCIHPVTKPTRLASELRYLRDLGGKWNVVQLHSAHFHMGSLFIVMDFIMPDRFTEFVAKLDYEEIWLYMENLLLALRHVHSNNVMHRDIKPANFLFNRKQKKFLLVDFGLAQASRGTNNNKVSGLITPSSTVNTINVTTPVKRLINFSSTGSPAPTQMLKKLRVSSTIKYTREPVKLTVGAYESPVTNNEIQNNRDSHKFSTPKVPRHYANGKCDCRGKPRTCANCLSKPEPVAPRSGTPGFKAPEILLRYPYQTTAIDIWSAGVIMISLLAGHSPIFRDTDDSSSLSEIITILGSQRVISAAEKLNIKLQVRPPREPVNLRYICRQIRSSNKDKLQIDIPEEAFDLLERMLDPNPLTRITADDALKHTWLKKPDCEIR